MGGCDRTFPPRLERFFVSDSPTQQLAARSARGRPPRVSRRRKRARRVARSRDIVRHRHRDRRPSRRRSKRSCAGWADTVWLQGQTLRDRRVREGRRAFRDHDVPRRCLPARQPQARSDVLRRHRDRPLAARLHRQRDGDLARRLAARPGSSIRTTGSPISRRGVCARRFHPRSRSKTTRCACCGRRGSSRRSASSPTPRSSPRSRRCTTGCRSSSAERIRDELSKLIVADDPSPGLWLSSRTGLADAVPPELNAMQLEQDPIHRHKDVLAHTIAVVAKTSPRLQHPPRGAVARRREAAAPADTGRRA